MCLYNRLVLNPKYKANKKNGGRVPPLMDERVKYVPVGCGQCMECRKQKAREWQARLLEDIKANTNGKFVCLTFSNESIAKIVKEIKRDNQEINGYELDNAIAIYAVRHFVERHRKKYEVSVRHWLVTELGHQGTENIHLHGIIWTDRKLEDIEERWQYGHMWKGEKRNNTVRDSVRNYVNESTISYMTKYVHKIDKKHTQYKSKVLTSPGIGANYVEGTDVKKNKFKNGETDEAYRTRSGHKMKIPIYWRNKIYTEEEREKLWLIKLDKQERWVNGERISIREGEEAYFELLKYHQERNERLGYGSDKKDWSREQYERERRMLMMKRRIRNANGEEIQAS